MSGCSGPSTKTVSVTVASADSTATAGSDYTALSPTVLTFAPGEVAKTVTVAVINDGVFEGNEFFAVNLTSPVNAPIADSQGAATMVDDEGPIAVSVADTSVTEGNTGTRTMTYTLSLSAAPSIGQTARVTVATANGTATAGGTADYTALTATPITFTAGQATRTVAVTRGAISRPRTTRRCC